MSPLTKKFVIFSVLYIVCAQAITVWIISVSPTGPVRHSANTSDSSTSRQNVSAPSSSDYRGFKV